MSRGYCRDRAPAWAQQSPNSSWTCLCHSSPFVDAIAIQRMLVAIFSFGGCGKNNLEVFFLPRQTSSQDTKRSNRSRTWNEEPWSEVALCNHCGNGAPGCQFSSPFVFSSSVLLDTAALCSFPEDLSSACAWTRPCHVEWGKWFLVTSCVAWQNWFAAIVPAESWHHVKAFTIGDMLIANLEKNHGLAVRVPFVYKESLIFRYFPSLLLPPFLGNDHGALTSAFVLVEILPVYFICLLTFFSLSLVFLKSNLVFFFHALERFVLPFLTHASPAIHQASFCLKLLLLMGFLYYYTFHVFFPFFPKFSCLSVSYLSFSYILVKHILSSSYILVTRIKGATYFPL